MKTIEATIPAGITSKRELLLALADGLKFPFYFGHNWDALYDLLRDFSWRDESAENITIIIRHQDVPALPPPHQEAYLDVLRSAIDSWSVEPKTHTLKVTFPDYFEW